MNQILWDSSYHLGKLTSLKDLNVKSLWTTFKGEDNVMMYFPDVCHKRMPPKDYFWKIYYYLRKESYTKLVRDQIDALKGRNKIKDDTIVMCSEAQTIFDNFAMGNDLKLLGMLISKTRPGFTQGAKCHNEKLV